MRFSDCRCTNVRVRSWTAARVAPRGPTSSPRSLTDRRDLNGLLVDLGEGHRGIEPELLDEPGQELLRRLTLLLQCQ